MSEPQHDSWDRPRPFVMDVVVEAAHIDFMQHTNNVVYLSWLEAVAWAHSERLGLGPSEYQEAGFGMVVRQHDLTYLLPTRLGDRLLLATWLIEVDRHSLRRQYQFIRRVDGQTVFRAYTRFLCVEIASGRLRRMPDRYLDLYTAAQVSEGKCD